MPSSKQIIFTQYNLWENSEVLGYLIEKENGPQTIHIFSPK